MKVLALGANRISKFGITPGLAVTLDRDVDRYPHVLAKAGLTGVIVSATNELISIKMDEVLEGVEQWDNCLEFYPRNTGDEDLESFLLSVKRADGVPFGEYETPRDRAAAVVDDALSAFWEVVAKRVPEAAAGDLDPLTVAALETQAKSAIQAWILNNCE